VECGDCLTLNAEFGEGVKLVAGARCNLNRTIVLYRPAPNSKLPLI